MKFTIQRDKAAKWRWKLVANNNEIVACSSQGFARKLDCQINCELTFDGLRENKGAWHTYRDSD
jgi:uncharacterized protein YegP (UPF0339 family)